MPTAAVALEDQVRILRSYVTLSKNGTIDIHYKKVVEDTKLARTQISGVNSFFQSLGFLITPKRGYYRPVESVVRFANLLPPANPFLVLVDTIRESRLWKTILNKFVISQKTKIERVEIIKLILRLAASDEKYRAESALSWLIRAGFLIEDGEKYLSLSSEGNDYSTSPDTSIEGAHSKIESQNLNLDVPEGFIQVKIDEKIWIINRETLVRFVLENGTIVTKEFVL